MNKLKVFFYFLAVILIKIIYDSTNNFVESYAGYIGVGSFDGLPQLKKHVENKFEICKSRQTERAVLLTDCEKRNRDKDITAIMNECGSLSSTRTDLYPKPCLSYSEYTADPTQAIGGGGGATQAIGGGGGATQAIGGGDAAQTTTPAPAAQTTTPAPAAQTTTPAPAAQTTNPASVDTSQYCKEIQQIMEDYPQIVAQNIFELRDGPNGNGSCAAERNGGNCDNSFYTWHNFARAVTMYNNANPDNPWLSTEYTKEARAQILCCFFANIRYEAGSKTTAPYLYCRERLASYGTEFPDKRSPTKDALSGGGCAAPAAGTNCSRGLYSSYPSGKWNQFLDNSLINKDDVDSVLKSAYRIGHSDNFYEDGCAKRFSKCTCAGGVLTSENCKDVWGQPLPPKYCYYGRGAKQLTWAGNYANATETLKGVQLDGVPLDFCMKPDTVCQDGRTAFLAAIAFWIDPQNNPPLSGDEAALAGWQSMTGIDAAIKKVVRPADPSSNENRKTTYAEYAQKLNLVWDEESAREKYNLSAGAIQLIDPVAGQPCTGKCLAGGGNECPDGYTDGGWTCPRGKISYLCCNPK